MNLIDFLPFDDDNCLNIMGFRFHLDDLLIMALLFFLYTQKVEDKFLYIILVMLLINN